MTRRRRYGRGWRRTTRRPYAHQDHGTQCTPHARARCTADSVSQFVSRVSVHGRCPSSTTMGRRAWSTASTPTRRPSRSGPPSPPCSRCALETRDARRESLSRIFRRVGGERERASGPSAPGAARAARMHKISTRCRPSRWLLGMGSGGGRWQLANWVAGGVGTCSWLGGHGCDLCGWRGLGAGRACGVDEVMNPRWGGKRKELAVEHTPTWRRPGGARDIDDGARTPHGGREHGREGKVPWPRDKDGPLATGQGPLAKGRAACLWRS